MSRGSFARLLLCAALAAISPRALAAPSIAPTVDDAITQSLDATSHTTTATLRSLDSSYVVSAPSGGFRNDRLVLSNPDPRTAIAVKLDVAGRPDLSSVDGLLASAIDDTMSPEQKSIAIWRLVVDWRYHYIPADAGPELHDPVKLLNVYGYGFCDDAAYAIAALANAAGLPSRVMGLDGHAVAEIQYDGAWHMYDGDHEVYYRAADGHVMSVDELAADPSPILATPLDPIGTDTALMASLYTSTANNGPYAPAPPPTHRIEPVLQPLDRAVFDLAPGTVYSETAEMRAAFPLDGPPPAFANGALIRQLDFTQSAGEAVLPVSWPFILVGGHVVLQLARDDASLEVAIACDGGSYDVVPGVRAGAALSIDLGPWFAARGNGSYACSLRVRTLGAATLAASIASGEARWIFQFSPRALQQLKPGDNGFHAVLAPVGGSLPADWAGFQIAHQWSEPRDFLRPGAQRWTQGGSQPTQLIDAAASFDADSVVLTVLTGGARIPILMISIDADVNPATGYLDPASGAEFMVLSGSLFRWNGPPSSTPTLGSWTWAGSAPTTSPRPDVTQIAIPRGPLGLPPASRANLRIRALANATTVLDELPRGANRWQVSVPFAVKQEARADTDLTRAAVAFDASQMTVTVEGAASAPDPVNVFLDTDADGSTGYQAGSLGAEFLISSGLVYRYAGTQPDEWRWISAGKAPQSNPSANVLEIDVPLSALGLGNGAPVKLRVDSWRGWTTLLDQIPRSGDWSIIAPNVVRQVPAAAGDFVSGEVTVQAASLLFALETLGQPIQLLHVLLNTDGDTRTGYAHRGLGSEYMVENGSLYRFSGATPADWSWTRVDSVQIRALGANEIEVVVPTANMGPLASPITAVVESWGDWSTLVDSLPAAPEVWTIRW